MNDPVEDTKSKEAAISPSQQAREWSVTKDDETVALEVASVAGFPPPLANVFLRLKRVDGTTEDTFDVRQRSITIGRDKHCDVVVNDSSLSRQHAELRLGQTGWIIEDLGSTNGTSVNDSLLHEAASVGHGDLIQMGGCVLEMSEVAPQEDRHRPPPSEATDVVARAEVQSDIMAGVSGQGWHGASRAASQGSLVGHKQKSKTKSKSLFQNATTARNVVIGEARGVQQRSEQRTRMLAPPTGGTETEYVWSFRLQRHDAAGDPMAPVAVEIRGKSLYGIINEGDIVEVPGRDRGRGIVHPKSVFNRTTNSWAGTPVRQPALWTPLLLAGISLAMNDRFSLVRGLLKEASELRWQSAARGLWVAVQLLLALVAAGLSFGTVLRGDLRPWKRAVCLAALGTAALGLVTMWPSLRSLTNIKWPG